jgi:phosphatidate cytidylyltransferase
VPRVPICCACSSAVGAILVLASLVGYLLQRRFSPDGGNLAVENLNERIRAWWFMAVLLAIAFAGGRTGVILLFGFCSFAALREFLTITNARRADHWSLVAAFFVVLPVQYYLALGRTGTASISIFVPVYVVPAPAGRLGAAAARRMRYPGPHCRGAVGADDLRLLRLARPGAAQPWTSRAFDGRNVLLIAFLVDRRPAVRRAAICLGQAVLGKHKIAPKLSPSKTVEGFVGGVLSATADRRRPLVDDARSRLAQAGLLAFTIAHDGLLRRPGDVGRSKARPRRQGLGPSHRRPWRPHRPAGLRRLLGADLLPPRALLVVAVDLPA